MKEKSTLNLAQIRICPNNSPLDIKTEFATKRQSSRHAFPIAPNTDKIAIETTFIKEDICNDIRHSGLRQLISIKLFNSSDGILVSETSFYAYLPKDINKKTYIKTLDFNYFNIRFTSRYTVIVINESINQQIGNYSFTPIDSQEISGGLSKPITMDYARCISHKDDGDYNYYLSLNPKNTPFSFIGFWGSTKFEEFDFIMEELEIKIHYPDGRVESYIKPPVFDAKLGDEEPGALNNFRISEYFSFREQGIYYAELLLLGTPISGFIFSTSEHIVVGEWKDYDENLNPIIGYTPELGEKIYQLAHDSIAQGQECSDEDSHTDNNELPIEWDDNAFDKLLDDFIKSEQEENQNKNSQINEEENDEEDDELEQPSNENNSDNEYQGVDNEKNQVNDRIDEQSHDTSNEDYSWEKLDNLTGLKSVKEKLYTLKNLANFTNLRAEKHLSTINLPLHAMFLGSPGTGKTTVAKALGKMLADAGILSKGHVVVKERANLIGKYYGCEEENTLKAIEDAQGGILFIDEAYQLVSEQDPRDPGRFVIETLITKLSDETNRDWMLILAGYPDEMIQLHNINPGLASRIPQSNIYTFDDFSGDELMEIAEIYLKRNQYVLSDEAREALFNRLKADYSSRDKSFGNARHVINLIQLEILPRIATRITNTSNPSIDDLVTILATDIPQPANANKPTSRRIGFCA